ncbi:hypothetical protein C0Q70_04370 [Pomacea canaliculata]|uniref:Tubulin delta chain n=1 Tax=Pomacea canaliculata TaxID=400727 RepID=A0A2T7PVC5_POMCA|nr:hypothetical protein C0Q70_04370 [Pomacea canaliculata]
MKARKCLLFLFTSVNVVINRSFVTVEGFNRAVHVDGESKVIKRLSSVMKIREKNVITGKRGRGNNWSLGYHGLHVSGDDCLLEETLESIRREVERCDMFSGFLLTHSLSGGTGSGFGSHLCEALRDKYPVNYLMSVAIGPCASGESPLQHYNSVLCLAALQRTVDGIILIQNDDILDKLHKKSPDCQVSFEAVNKVIAHTIAGLVLPTDSLTTSRNINLGQEPWELLKIACPMPATKFLQATHLAKSKLSWEGLVTKVLHATPRYSHMGKPFSSLASVLTARGDTTGSFHKSLKLGLDKRIRSALNFVDWNPFPIDVWTAFVNTTGPKDTSSITMALNSSCVTQYFDAICQRAELMVRARAYLHWYERYGTFQEDIEEAMRVVHTCQDNYNEAIKQS